MAETSMPVEAAGVQAVRLAELRHRYANAVQLAANLLAQQARRCRDSQAAGALLDAAARLGAIGQLYFALDADGVGSAQSARAFLDALRHHLDVAYLGGSGVVCIVEAEEVRLPMETCRRLGLIVHELVVNSVKHAFAGRGGQVCVRLHSVGDGLWRCTVEDDGAGFDVPGPRRIGLGHWLVSELARQMGGTHTRVVGSGGACVHVDFPCSELPAAEAT